jgi:hypothetical protein
LTVHFLASNGVRYLTPVHDPWFAATQVINDSVPYVAPTLYRPDAYVAVLACTDQYQLCNPNQHPYNCSIIGSLYDIKQASALIGLNAYQTATAYRFTSVVNQTSTYSTVNYLGTTALLARDRLAGIVGLGLPNNQWELEVQGWFETSLANIQSYVVEYAANVVDLGPYGYIQLASEHDGPVAQAAQDLCGSQRIRNTGKYQSFSFAGVMIIFGVGTGITLLSWIVEPLVAYLRYRNRPQLGWPQHDYREISRVADQKLQLLRMALTGAGYSEDWEKVMGTFPVAKARKEFRMPARRAMNSGDGDDDYYYPGPEAEMVSRTTMLEDNVLPASSDSGGSTGDVGDATGPETRHESSVTSPETEELSPLSTAARLSRPEPPVLHDNEQPPLGDHDHDLEDGLERPSQDSEGDDVEAQQSAAAVSD